MGKYNVFPITGDRVNDTNSEMSLWKVYKGKIVKIWLDSASLRETFVYCVAGSKPVLSCCV